MIAAITTTKRDSNVVDAGRLDNQAERLVSEKLDKGDESDENVTSCIVADRYVAKGLVSERIF